MVIICSPVHIVDTRLCRTRPFVEDPFVFPVFPLPSGVSVVYTFRFNLMHWPGKDEILFGSFLRPPFPPVKQQGKKDVTIFTHARKCF